MLLVQLIAALSYEEWNICFTPALPVWWTKCGRCREIWGQGKHAGGAGRAAQGDGYQGSAAIFSNPAGDFNSADFLIWFNFTPSWKVRPTINYE